MYFPPIGVSGEIRPLHLDFEKPLTLTLSRGERGLIAVFWRAAPTCDTEPSSDFEKPPIGSLSLYPLGERAGVRGMDLKHTTKT
jgi:hypothetical protein